MAAVSLSPPLLLLSVLLLTTAGTSQCHGHNKHHHHHTDGTRKPNKDAAAADTVHHAICHKTPHPVSCLGAVASHLDAVASAKVAEASAVSVQLLPPNVLSVVLASLRGAASALSSLSPAISTLSAPAASPTGASLRRGAAQDCQELHAASLSSLSRSASLLAAPSEGLPAVRAHLAAALTNKATCLDGLAGASGPGMGGLLASLDDAYEHVSNSLALVAPGGGVSAGGFANAVAKAIHNRRLLQDDDDDDGDSGDDDNNNNGDGHSGNADQPAATVHVITVAKDGTRNFRTVGEAVAAAPNYSRTRTVIRVKAGTYEENVEVPPYKTNIALVGEGRDRTVITGSRSAAGGWTTFRSATFGVSGEGFLARDVTFRNTAGAAGVQAVALRVNADLAAVYRCGVEAHQDALYAHSFRQFYRECAVAGTVDIVFGDASAVLQGCELRARAPLPGQSVVLTAQGRGDPNEDTGIAVHNCTVSAAREEPMPDGTRTFLGRPWGAYARAVVMDSYLGQIVDREGWMEWPGAEPGRGDTVYFGEYGNVGPGAETEGRVDWAGVREMDYDEAAQFAVQNFIYGDDWLGATSFPYDDDV
ncbi:putative pectinesterase/pectinesterase inhibitor 12 [Dichanthelium oligosanthes]|uniref:Pectinesterase n=1 Tax=Dichanthelium oligosanthes TaxID=888268 RepID=A0A1E5WMQ9_9POAL|nr:putative pectinesterase/pectinesterase inhibitor 12 [Dichanthelium oligosanthes]